MRIAVFHNLPSGGAKRALFEWIKRLVNRHEIDVFTLSSADHDFCDLRPFARQHISLDYRPHKLFASPYGRLNAFQRWRDLLALDKIQQRLAQVINSGRYDIFFANPCRFTFVPSILQHVKIPSIYYLHEPVGAGSQRKFTRPYINSNLGSLPARLDRVDPLLALYLKSLANVQTKSLLSATRLLANSQYTRSQVMSNYPVTPEVCYLGVNTDDFYPIESVEKSNTVISVGELTPRKGFDFLILSLALIPTVHRPALRIASNWDDPLERTYLLNLASENQVSLDLVGKLDEAQLRLEYNRAKLCLYTPVLEPFGLVPLEAMACGTPVVGIREGGVPESIQDRITGLLLARDLVLFAESIESLLVSPDSLQQLGFSAREYARSQWSWSNAVVKLEEQLEASAFSSKVAWH